MAFPNSLANLEYLYQNNIKHLITLSDDFVPPVDKYNKIEWTLIPVEEFHPPGLKDIETFIGICEESFAKDQAVGVHCRQGRGRTGVMAACYLVKYQNLPPENAITKIRLQRPGSIETYEQERAVFKYFDYIRGTKN